MPSFASLFGRPPTVTASAPGRVNLIGEHTDYNGGFVLPSAIPQRTVVECAARGGSRVRIASADVDDGAVAAYELGTESTGRGWLDYVQGCTTVLAAAGHVITGFDAVVRSDVPLGAGLSSSAALEVALLRALRTAFDLGLDDVMLARLGQRAENEFVGARVGIMDPMAASLAGGDEAIFIDTRSLAWERVAMPPDASLAVVDSGIAHEHAAGEYNVRRDECERAAALLGVTLLRELAASDEPRIARLPPPLDRRVRHVVSENARVLAAVQAMRAGEVATLGRLFGESHASMRDDYEVSIPQIDAMVEIAEDLPDVLGARLTGGGFGGSIVVLAKAGSAAHVAASVVERARTELALRPSVRVPFVPGDPRE